MCIRDRLAGLKAVSNDRGVIAAAAMDQRGSLQKSLAKERGAEATGKDLEDFKTLVTDVLCKHASAILLDPEFGLPASKHRHGKGLLLAYEKTGYDSQTPGRLPDLLDVWSVRRLKEAGADCIKILLYYTPFEKSSVNDLKQAWIERIGDECMEMCIRDRPIAGCSSSWRRNCAINASAISSAYFELSIPSKTFMPSPPQPVPGHPPYQIHGAGRE